MDNEKERKERSQRLLLLPANASNEQEVVFKKREQAEQQKKPQIVRGCFIATAAMGSELDPHVAYLRNFRDNIVLRSRYGVAFERVLDLYYSFSPPIANSIAKVRTLQMVVRYAVVYPLVFSLRAFVKAFDFASEMKDDVPG